VLKKFFLTCTKLAIDQTAIAPQLSYRTGLCTPLLPPLQFCFFRINSISSNPGVKVDALGKLVVLSYKCCGEGRLNLLNKVLDSIVQILLKNYESKKMKFNQRPFYRLLATLLIDLNAVTPETDPSHLQLLLAFRYTLRSIGVQMTCSTSLTATRSWYLPLLGYRDFVWPG